MMRSLPGLYSVYILLNDIYCLYAILYTLRYLDRSIMFVQMYI
jgi:hypothetical protein